MHGLNSGIFASRQKEFILLVGSGKLVCHFMIILDRVSP